MGIYFKMYYAGQGALNLLWVKEDDGSVPYAALFDAGSNSDPMRKRMESLVEAAGILNAAKYSEAFITHMDSDHYNLLPKIGAGIDAFYLGSVDADSQWQKDRWIRYIEQFTDKSNVNVHFFPEQAADRGASAGRYQNLEISLIMANYGREVNDRCAVYGIRTDRAAVIVTGDMTGNTFWNLHHNNIYNSICGFIGSRVPIVTVPHHGALETLTRGGFVSLESSPSGFKSYNMDRLKAVIQESGMKESIFLASAGKHRLYKHPRQDVMVTLQNLSRTIRAETQRYLIYRGANEMLSSILGCGWVSQWFLNTNKAIYGTILDTDQGGNMDPDFLMDLQKYSYEIRLDAPSVNDNSFYIRAYDHRQKPVFEDIFLKEEGELRHDRRVYYKEGVRQ